MSNISSKSRKVSNGNQLTVARKTKRLESSLEIYRNLPNSAKNANSRIPEPQFHKILARHMNGESVRSISRKEGRARETVGRVINSDEARKIIQLMRSEVYALAGAAIGAVRHGLQQQKDARLGYKLLVDLGAVPCSAETQSIALQAMQPEAQELTPFERASAQDESGQINRIQLALVRIAQERASQFGLSMPTVAEIWRNRTVAALINDMTGGQSLTVSLTDGPELNRLKKLAEDVLGGRRSMTDQEIVAVRKKYSD